MFFDGVQSLPNIPSLLSLIPIALGIAAASWNSPTFEWVGFLAAVLSAFSQSALNVTSKRALSQTGLSGPTIQRTMVAVGTVITIVLNLVQMKRINCTTSSNLNQHTKIDDKLSPKTWLNEVQHQSIVLPPLWLTIMAVTAYHVEYILSFTFVKLVQPVTYGTCDALRRLCIILVGRQFFGKDRLTRINIGGIGLALLGALAYSIASTTL